jgi:hypothetical protein
VFTESNTHARAHRSRCVPQYTEIYYEDGVQRLVHVAFRARRCEIYVPGCVTFVPVGVQEHGRGNNN